MGWYMGWAHRTDKPMGTMGLTCIKSDQAP